VALKTAGTVVSSGLSFIAKTSGSVKWVYDITGALVSVPANQCAVDYHPTTHAVRGLRVEPTAINLLWNSLALSTQSVTVTASVYTLAFFGTGTITLSGASTAGPLVGTGPGQVKLTFTPTAGSLTLTVSGTVSFAQLELGSRPTSFISTAGAAGTRAGDLYNVTPSSINYSATAGSWWMDLELENPQGGAARIIGYVVGISAPFFVSNATTFGLYGGAATLSKTVSSVYGNHKLSCAFQSGDRALTADGLTVATDALETANLLAPSSPIYLGAAASGFQMSGWIRQVRYLPQRITNAEMVTETT
jgi:hypothetical protein